MTSPGQAFQTGPAAGRVPGTGTDLPDEVDVVVVGAGAAGCVVAARLSEEPGCSVLLLEGGGVDDDADEVRIPGLATMGLGSTTRVVPHPTTPQRDVGRRVVPLVTGSGLGGGSSANSMWWFQGQPGDFDDWAVSVGPDWSWQHVQALFRRIEDHELGAGEFHGAGGPMAVTSPHHVHPFSAAFLRAGVSRGWPVSRDFNGSARVGIGMASTTIRDGARCSVVDGYLRPALSRPGHQLSVRLGAPVQQVVVEGNRAVGVRCGTALVRARRCVVLAAGAVGTPQLLLLSGIGPAEHLREHGVDVVRDLAGVGQGLQDHPGVVLPWSLRGDPDLLDGTYTDARGMYDLLRRGPLSGIGAGVAALDIPGVPPIRGEDAPGRDDADRGPGPTIHISTALIGVDAGLDPVQVRTVLGFVALVDPRSRGQLQLASADPAQPPLVDPGYLSHHADRPLLRAGIAEAFALFDTPALRQVVQGSLVDLDPTDPDAVDAAIDAGLITYQHLVGGACMGSGPDAVVGSDLAVRGLRGLRVADASVMPRITRGNTQAPTVVIAERAADLIRAETVSSN